MRIKIPHIKYIANKISLDLFNSKIVTFSSGIEQVSTKIAEILKDDVLKELSINEKANALLEENLDEFDSAIVDRRNLFFLVKKRIANDEGFELNFEDRYANLSYEILSSLWKKSLIDYSVSENRVKNIIFQSIISYLKIFEDLEDNVVEKLKNNPKLIPGTNEYDLAFEKFYEEELRKRGMF